MCHTSVSFLCEGIDKRERITYTCLYVDGIDKFRYKKEYPEFEDCNDRTETGSLPGRGD